MTQKKDKQYFTEVTEEAIVKYNSSTDEIEKNIIYRSQIHPAFCKLAENLIHTFKYYNTETTDLHDLQHEVVTFLVTKLHRFDSSNGAKAYSYFGTVGKRYLIARSQKNYRNQLDLISYDPTTEESSDSETTVHGFQIQSGYDINEYTVDYSEDLNKFIQYFVEYCDNNLYVMFTKKEDIQIADAILELFKKRDNITIFNKKALYLYIREIVDVKTSKITKIATQLRDLFNYHYTYYLQHGYTKLQSRTPTMY